MLVLVVAAVAIAVAAVVAMAAFSWMMGDMGMGGMGGQPNQVTIMNYRFGPQTLQVKAGTTVRWVNMDMVDHTVTGGGLASPTLGHMGSYAFTFTRPGRYGYICGLHPYMTASVVVT